MKQVIILGGGASIQEGLDKDLWTRIEPFEKWSLNSIFKIMPYLPTRQLWVDIDFLDNNVEALLDLNNKGVLLVSKKFSNRKRHLQFVTDSNVTEYDSTRERDKYLGKEAIQKGVIYYGEMGLCGMFATSLAIAEGYTDIYWLGMDFGNDSLQNKKTHVYQTDDVFVHADISAPKPEGKTYIYSTGAGRPEVYRLPEGIVKREIADFDVFNREKDVKIWNVSLNSNIEFYEKISYDQFFNKFN